MIPNTKINFSHIITIQIEAKDPDLGRNGQVMYTVQKGVNASLINDNFFAVDPHQGTIVIANNPLPKGKHTLFIEAVDQPVNPTERRFSLAVVTIHVISSGKYTKAVPFNLRKNKKLKVKISTR